jgi:2-iminobutanoate/2-iminopropanoate deaminase
MVYLSGQVAFVVETGELELSSIPAETHQVMKNLKAVLEEARLTFAHVVKTTIFLSDMALFAQVNEVYGTYFSGDYPARETVAVKGLPRGVNVEISMIAVVDL